MGQMVSGEMVSDNAAAAGALAGLRVIDMSTFLAAPQISSILGDFGADVIKLEPPKGEASRTIGAQRNGASLVWAFTSRNKRTITLNLNDERGRDLLRELVKHIDVLVENYPASQLAEWGLSYDDLRGINAGLIMVSVSCYGGTGPLAVKYRVGHACRGIWRAHAHDRRGRWPADAAVDPARRHFERALWRYRHAGRVLSQEGQRRRRAARRCGVL